jgi:hypothetical protein
VLASRPANLRRTGILVVLIATGGCPRALEARRLEARVTSESGDQVPALVRVLDALAPDAGLEPPIASQLAGDGRVSIGFPAGPFAVEFSSPGMATLRLELEPPRAGFLDLGNLALVRAQPVQGRVLDPSGAPVARAIVEIERSAALQGFATFRGRATTGPDGSFMVLVAPPPPARLIVRAPGWAPGEMAIDDEGEAIDVRLDRGRSITGTVRNADGAPAVGAWIGSGRARARSGPDGTFRIHVSASERWLVARDGVQRALGEVADGVTLTLRPPAAFVGVIRDAVTQQPVTGARILVERRQRAGLVSWVERQDVLAADKAAGDRAGRFALGGLLPGPALVRFEAEGYLPEERSISLVSGRAVSVEMSLRRRPVLHGRVTDAAGRPVPHAQIEAVDPDGHRTLQRASGGQFRLSVKPVPGLRIRARAPGLDGLVEIDVDPAAGPLPSELRVELHPTVRASGRIFQDSGEPAAAARARLLEHSTGGPRTAWTTADGLGRFSFEELARGKYVLQVRHARHALAHQEVEISGLEPAPPIEVHLERSAPIAGRVTSDGEPLTGATVSAHWGDIQRTTIAGTDGRFVFDETPRGTPVVLIANAAGLVAASKVVETPSSNVELALSKPASLSGSVVDASGRPQHLFEVTLTPTGDGPGMRPVPFQQQFTNKAGRFSVRGLSDASYELVICAPGGERARREITLGSGEHSDLAQIVLSTHAGQQCGFIAMQ